MKELSRNQLLKCCLSMMASDDMYGWEKLMSRQCPKSKQLPARAPPYVALGGGAGAWPPAKRAVPEGRAFSAAVCNCGALSGAAEISDRPFITNQDTFLIPRFRTPIRCPGSPRRSWRIRPLACRCGPPVPRHIYEIRVPSIPRYRVFSKAEEESRATVCTRSSSADILFPGSAVVFSSAWRPGKRATPLATRCLPGS